MAAEKAKENKKEDVFDAIRAERFEKEINTLKVWEEKWGFLKKEQTGKTNINVIDNEYGLSLPAKSKRLVSKKDMDSLMDTEKTMDIDSLTSDDMKAFYLFTHQIDKLKEANGELYDKYYFPPTSNSQFGWWTKDAMKRLEHDKKRQNAAKLNTLLDVTLTRAK